MTSSIFYVKSYADFNKIFNKEIKNQITITDSNNILDIRKIINLELENNITFSSEDGTIFNGVVKYIKVSEDNNIIKIFGDILNHEKSAFGFVLNRSGEFAGAIIFKSQAFLYSVENSKNVNGFVFVKKNLEN